jgi:hypothetical protein
MVKSSLHAVPDFQALTAHGATLPHGVSPRSKYYSAGIGPTESDDRPTSLGLRDAPYPPTKGFLVYATNGLPIKYSYLWPEGTGIRYECTIAV